MTKMQSIELKIEREIAKTTYGTESEKQI